MRRVTSLFPARTFSRSTVSFFSELTTPQAYWIVGGTPYYRELACIKLIRKHQGEFRSVMIKSERDEKAILFTHYSLDSNYPYAKMTGLARKQENLIDLNKPTGSTVLSNTP